MKPVLLAVLAYLLLSGTPQATAQPADKKQCRGDYRALRTEMRAWFERSVLPTILEWKRDYDASLSADDLATLNALRAEAKAHRLKHHEDGRHEGGRADGNHQRDDGDNDDHQSDAGDNDDDQSDAGNNDDDQSDDGNNDDDQSDDGEVDDDHADDSTNIDRQGQHAARKVFFEHLKPIAERSKDKLRSIFENGKDQIEVWHDEAMDIFDYWQASHPNAHREFDRHIIPQPIPIGPGHGHMGKRAAIRFMLWDGTVGADDALVGTMAASPMRVAPLPAGNTVALALDDMPDGPAKIELFTMDGNLVKSVSVTISGNALDEMIDVSSLPTGTYMASINTTMGRRTSQIVVTR